MGERVVVAMSGGVDSSVAAALLVEQGYEVIGVTMQIWPELAPEEEARRGGCCSLGAVEDARRVADLLGIPYYVLNLREVFAAEVVDYFVAEYAAGRTPNPCIACNRRVKFEPLLRKALELGAARLATGHYARLEYDPARGRHLLRRGVDRRKDQSYVLYCLRQDQLRRLLFPLGGYTKEEVRRMAAARGLPVAGKPESQEICFVEDDDHGRFVAERAPGAARPGPILDAAGRRLGTHRGLAYYTIGQRRGLGLAADRPLYVVEIDAARNALIVAPEEETRRAGMLVRDLNFIPFDRLEGEMAADVQIRYKAEPRPARIRPVGEDEVEVRFDAPQRSIAPGQAAVFYRGDLVIGGGVIDNVFDG